MEKEAAGAVGGRDQENTGWYKKSQIVSRYKNAVEKEFRVYANKKLNPTNNQALEAALRSLSYDTLVKVKESIAREAACRELERQGGEGGDGDGEGGRRDREVEEQGAVTSRPEERPNLPPSPHSPPHSRPSPGLPQYSLSSQVYPPPPPSPPSLPPPPCHHLLTIFSLPGRGPAELQHPAA